jgi:hypothetical protein
MTIIVSGRRVAKLSHNKKFRLLGSVHWNGGLIEVVFERVGR